MNIIPRMTRDARCGLPGRARLGGGVAPFAGNSAMCPGQGEIRLPIVIEYPEGPTIGIVTGLAGGPKPRLVLVILLVAASAIRVGRRKDQGGMTRFALDRAVLADQGEIGEIVVKGNIGEPVRGRMTICAGRSERSTMWIIDQMAICADAVLRVGVYVLRVTIVARGLAMGTVQTEICVLVVIKLDFSPLGFGVAGFAFRPETVSMYVLDAVTTDTCQR